MAPDPLHSRPDDPLEVHDVSSHLIAIIDSAMDAIITVDDSQLVVMYNKAAERVFGVPIIEALGSPLERFIPERYRKNHSRHVHEFADTGSTQRAMGKLGTIYGLRADGGEFPIEASISQAMFAGRRYFTVILRDISERKRLESQLLQAQKMESIGRLAGGIAHDFNNLLMAMFNYLALAGRKLEPEHAARPYLKHTQEVAERAATLTRQLLAFARKQTLHPRLLNIRDVVLGVEPMLRRLIGEDIAFRTVLADDAGSVMADPSQLEQVLMNLAINARDAMPDGGTLTIESREVVLDDAYCRVHTGATPGPHVLLAVTDSGCGMPPDVLTRLFEPFFTTKAPGKGTGLGLATSHGIINQHGGHIAVYSEVARGTCVKVFLPRHIDAATHKPEDAAPAPTPRGGGETILLAEDSQFVRDLAASALREAGYTVLPAANGAIALKLATAHPDRIHLLISDVVMPELGGVKLAAALRQARTDIRVILMSGYTEETAEIQDQLADASRFIMKPFMTDDMLRIVREVLDSKGASPLDRAD